MQAIQTKFLPCTDAKDARIKAFCERGSLTVGYPYELSGDAVHQFAVDALVERFCDQDLKAYGTPVMENPWNGPYASGSLPDGTMAHVFCLLP